MFSFSGIHWVTGLSQLVLSLLTGCKRIITDKPFSGEYFVEVVSKYKVSFTFLSTRHASALLNCSKATETSLATLKLVGMVGGIISFNTLKRLQQMIPKNCILWNGYGMTESGMISTKLGDNGPLITPGLHVRIVSEDGENLGPNLEGEIVVHNGQNWPGYYGNKTETNKIMTKDGWISTGDVGYFDDKLNLHVVDRKKEVLKHEGVQYWPAEIEHVIVELPDVVDACVLGIYDESRGDVPAALVIRKEGSSITEQEVKDHVAKRIPMTQKHLKAGVKFVKEFAYSANAKIDKKKLIEIINNN